MLDALTGLVHHGARFYGRLPDGGPVSLSFSVQPLAVIFSLQAGADHWQGMIVSESHGRPAGSMDGVANPWIQWKAAALWLLVEGCMVRYDTRVSGARIEFETDGQVQMVWNFAPDAPTVALPPHASPEVRLYSDKMPPPVDLIALRLGLSSFERLLDPLMARITSIRRHIALELGLVVPGVRFRDDRLLPADGYAIDLHALEVARAELRRDHVLAIAPEDRLAKLHGEKTTDPTYGMPGLWIEISQKEAAEALGCMIFDEISVIATQLTEAVRVHAHELLGMQEVKALFDALAKSHPVVAESLPLSVAELHQVLQRLVRERVSIRDMVTILETLTREAPDTRDIETLTERVRVALQKVICKEHTNNEGAINVITVDPSIENMLLQGREIGPEGAPFVIDPMAGQSVLQAIGCEVQKLQERGLQSILLTSPELRPAAVKLVARSFPKMVVLSWNEIPPRVNINPIGMVSAG